MIEDWSLWQNLDVLANNIFAVHKLMQQKIFRYILLYSKIDKKYCSFFLYRNLHAYNWFWTYILTFVIYFLSKYIYIVQNTF